VCVPSSTYCTHGAVKYWEYARQYLGGYGITLCCACTVVDATAWCHAQHHIECSIPRLAPLPFHLPFHQQGHLIVAVPQYLGGFFRTTVLLLFYSSIQHCHGALYSTRSIFYCCHFLAFYRRRLSCCRVSWGFCDLLPSNERARSGVGG
jgi:hypothetical protein